MEGLVKEGQLAEGRDCEVVEDVEGSPVKGGGEGEDEDVGLDCEHNPNWKDGKQIDCHDGTNDGNYLEAIGEAQQYFLLDSQLV